jgi:MscS family membrane protein
MRSWVHHMLASWTQDPRALAAAEGALIFLLFLIAALVVWWLGERVARRLVRTTVTQIDDVVFDRLLGPTAISLILAGIWYGLLAMEPGEAALGLVRSLLLTCATLMWGSVFFYTGAKLLEHASNQRRSWRFLERRTLPLFDISWKTLTLAATGYFVMVSWEIDATAWLASAGVVGLAVGLAAQDTLANLFAGVSLIADAPYKIGDVLVLEDGTRGVVTEIGLRSTRVQTMDDVEVIVPNAKMASNTVINESSGVEPCERVSCSVEVAYGSDLDLVRQVLLNATAGTRKITEDVPRLAPRVRFQAFADSGIKVSVYVWIADPRDKVEVVDQLVVRVHGALRAAGIEIPFPQRDLWVRAPLEVRSSAVGVALGVDGEVGVDGGLVQAEPGQDEVLDREVSEPVGGATGPLVGPPDDPAEPGGDEAVPGLTDDVTEGFRHR